MLIPWKDEFNLGIASIDVQHKKLIGIINALGAHLSSTSNQDDVNIAIAQMEAYVKEHFLYEEEYFKSFQYAETESHLAEHRIFLEKTAEFRSRALSEDVTLSVEMLGYLEEWFLHHVQVVDRGYVEEFQKHGIK